MKYRLCFLFLGLFISMGCQNKSVTQSSPVKEQKENKEIQERENLEKIALALKAKAEEKTDYELAQSLVDGSIRYAKAFSSSEHTPSILFRAGEVARSIKKYEQAMTIFTQIYTDFPKNPFAVKALFMEASLLQDDLKDKEQAKLRYEKVINKYPDDFLAEQAKQLLKVIDKTPEELIREFKKQ